MSKCYSRSGFSLIEMLMAMAIGMLIAGSIVTLLISQIQLTSTQNRNIINQETLRDTVRFMTEEILVMGSSIVEPYVSTANATELKYVGDLDGDGQPDQVRYKLNGAQLERTLYSTNNGGVTWSVVSTDVIFGNTQSLTFTYFGWNNSAPATVDDITSIEIQLEMDTTVDETAFTAGKLAPQAMVGRVTIRNRLL